MKKGFIISVVFNCLIVLFIIGKRYYYSHGQGSAKQPLETAPYDQWNKARLSVLNVLPIDKTDIVFVGNSLTEGFPVTELFGEHVKNRGIGGNATWHLLERIEKIAVKQPKKLFIEIGINDFNFGSTVDSAFCNYKAIVSAIGNISPHTTIFIQSLTPTCMSYSNITDSVTQLNTRLKEYCNLQGIAFIDLYTPLLKGTQLDSAYTEDGIHLNDKGYEIWRRVVEKYVR